MLWKQKIKQGLSVTGKYEFVFCPECIKEGNNRRATINRNIFIVQCEEDSSHMFYGTRKYSDLIMSKFE